jgi:hypothetical protein
MGLTSLLLSCRLHFFASLLFCLNLLYFRLGYYVAEGLFRLQLYVLFVDLIIKGSCDNFFNLLEDLFTLNWRWWLTTSWLVETRWWTWLIIVQYLPRAKLSVFDRFLYTLLLYILFVNTDSAWYRLINSVNWIDSKASFKKFFFL